jgi:hypothetical protein
MPFSAGTGASEAACTNQVTLTSSEAAHAGRRFIGSPGFGAGSRA